MNVADIFLNIGIKGAGTVFKALSGVNKGLTDISSESLAAKAGVFAVIYGLERLTGFASNAGMALNKFNLVTGLSTDELQKWQYAAMQFDVSGDEISGTIKSLQSIMTDVSLGKGAPEGAGLLGINVAAEKDAFSLLQKLAVAAKTLPPGVAGSMLKTFGISDNVFQMLRASNLELDSIGRKNIISKREIDQLTKVNIAWKDFWFMLRTMGMHIVAKEGIGAVHELADAFKFIIGVTDNIQRLIKEFPVLKTVAVIAAAAIMAAFAPWTAAAAGLLLVLSEIQKFREGKPGVISKTVDMVGDARDNLDESKGVGDRLKNHKMDLLKAAFGDSFDAFSGLGEMMLKGGKGLYDNFTKDNVVKPFAPNEPHPNQAQGVAQITNIFNIDGGPDAARDVASEFKKSVADTVRQNPAMFQHS